MLLPLLKALEHTVNLAVAKEHCIHQCTVLWSPGSLTIGLNPQSNPQNALPSLKEPAESTELRFSQTCISTGATQVTALNECDSSSMPAECLVTGGATILNLQTCQMKATDCPQGMRGTSGNQFFRK